MADPTNDELDEAPATPPSAMPVLRLDIDTRKPVLASHFSNIVTPLQATFDHWQAGLPDRMQRVELRIGAIRTGSLIADLVPAAAAFVTIYEFWDAAYGVMKNLRWTFDVMIGRSTGAPSDADQKVLDGLAAPILFDGATQVSLSIVGNNNNVIILTGQTAQAVRRWASEDPGGYDQPDGDNVLYDPRKQRLLFSVGSERWSAVAGGVMTEASYDGRLVKILISREALGAIIGTDQPLSEGRALEVYHQNATRIFELARRLFNERGGPPSLLISDEDIATM